MLFPHVELEIDDTRTCSRHAELESARQTDVLASEDRAFSLG